MRLNELFIYVIHILMWAAFSLVYYENHSNDKLIEHGIDKLSVQNKQKNIIETNLSQMIKATAKSLVPTFFNKQNYASINHRWPLFWKAFYVTKQKMSKGKLFIVISDVFSLLRKNVTKLV